MFENDITGLSKSKLRQIELISPSFGEVSWQYFAKQGIFYTFVAKFDNYERNYCTQKGAG